MSELRINPFNRIQPSPPASAPSKPREEASSVISAAEQRAAEVDSLGALVAAVAADLGELPFDAFGVSAPEPAGEASIEALAALAKGDPGLRALLRELHRQGQLYRADDSGETLADRVQTFLRAGGSLEDAKLVLQQLTDPERFIHQVPGKDTCVAYQAQLNWAQEAPGEYFRVATGILPDGGVNIWRGTNNQRDRLLVDDGGTENQAWINAQPWDANQKLNATMQTALTNLAFSGVGSYKIQNDRIGPARHRTQEGVSAGDATKFLARLLGYELRVSTDPEGALAEYGRAAAALEGGRPYVVPLRAPAGSDTAMHVVTITGIADGIVTYEDGGTRQMPVEQFLAEMQVDPALANGTIGSWSLPVAVGRSPAGNSRSVNASAANLQRPKVNLATVTLTTSPVTSTPAPVTSVAAPVTSTPAPVTSVAAPVTSTPAPVTSPPTPTTSTPNPTEASGAPAGAPEAKPSEASVAPAAASEAKPAEASAAPAEAPEAKPAEASAAPVAAPAASPSGGDAVTPA